jgi:hypothetical protein
MSGPPLPSNTVVSTVVDTTLASARDAAHFRDIDIARRYRRTRVAPQPNKEQSDNQSFGPPHKERDFDFTDHFFASDRRNMYSGSFLLSAGGSISSCHLQAIRGIILACV